MQVTARFQLIVNDVETGWRMVQETFPDTATPTDIMERLYEITQGWMSNDSLGGGDVGDIVIDTIIM